MSIGVVYTRPGAGPGESITYHLSSDHLAVLRRLDGAGVEVAVPSHLRSRALDLHRIGALVPGDERAETSRLTPFGQELIFKLTP